MGIRKAREIARGLFVLLGNCLVLVFFGQVVDGVVQATALLPLHRLLGDEVTDVDQVTQLANFARGLAVLEEAFRLLVEDVEAVPGPRQDSMIWFTSLMLWVIRTRSSLVIVPSSFHSGISVL